MANEIGNGGMGVVSPVPTRLRRLILEDASRAICNDREATYGSAKENFGKVAALWNGYLGGDRITAHDVGIMLALLKIARIATGKSHTDNYIDLCGYAALSGEIAGETAQLRMDIGELYGKE